MYGGCCLVVLACSSPVVAETVLRVGVSALPPAHGNPFGTFRLPSITTTSAIFDGLTRLDPEGKVNPALATEWRNVDRLTWRFTLREDVVFSNGAPFTADAVINTVSYLAGPGPAFENTRREMTFFAGARALGTHSVEITTSEPIPLLPRYLSVLLIPEPGEWRRLGHEGFAKAPVGSGPFKVESWQPARIALTAFRQSWRPPQVDRVEIVPVPDPAMRMQGVLSGRLDLATGIGPTQMETIELAGGQGVSRLNAAVEGISLVTTRPGPLQDVRVRLALNMAVNREPIIDVLLMGATEVAFQPAPRGTIGYAPDIEPYPYDPQQARALLKEAGYPAGFSFVMETTATSGNSTDVYQQVASDLRRIGVDMEIRVLANSRFIRNAIQTGQYADALYMPWPAWPILDSALVFKFHSCLHHVAWFCDESITPKIKAAMVEWDPVEAVSLRQEIMRHYHDQAPAIFLYEQVIFAGLSARTSGYEDVFGFVNYDQISIVE